MKTRGFDVVCDSSSIISFADGCFLSMLGELHEEMHGQFYITPGVKAESIDRPLELKSHTLAAVRLKHALNEGILRMVTVPVAAKADEILFLANNMFSLAGRPLRIVHQGEAEVLAAAVEMGVRNILIDERTTRMLAEDPEQHRSHLQDEFKAKVDVNAKNRDAFLDLTRGMTFFRSSELVMVAYERGFFKRFKGLHRQAIESSLYGIKFLGCGITFDEIEDFLKGLQAK